MFRFAIAVGFAFLAACAHAGDLDDAYARWNSLRNEETTVRFVTGVRFLYEHPGWPQEKTIRRRTEAAAFAEQPDREIMARFCADYPPLSGRGMLACSQAGAGTQKQQAQWLSDGWVEGDFGEAEENSILTWAGNRLDAKDHEARVDRLLYVRKTEAAKRLMPSISASAQRTAKVRLAFIAGDKKAMARARDLSTAEQRSAGILYERIRYAMRRGNENVDTLLAAVPNGVGAPDRWWELQRSAAREAIASKRHGLALKILNRHGKLEGEDLAEALWLKGWLLLRHTKNANAAYKQFYALYTNVSTPVSKARAAYWAGRAAEKNGNRDIAREWMHKAASRATVFYGQLAHAWLKPGTPLALPTQAKPTEQDHQRFARRELVRMAKALDYAGNTKERDMFIAALASQELSAGEFALLAQLASKLGGTSEGVVVAKKALRDGVVLLDTGWPVVRVPDPSPIDDSLALAITRQESEFNPTARSPANAHGLMQLLPSTAKQTAHSLGLDYSDRMLADPLSNMRLGTTYLAQMIEGFGGSYILGIASYNAGPGNVRKWMKSMGKPPQRLDAAIDWIESIPFTETRNYVMRALENRHVYRALQSPGIPLSIEKDLTR
jgi:soluble lytic murein transglycosylase